MSFRLTRTGRERRTRMAGLLFVALLGSLALAASAAAAETVTAKLGGGPRLPSRRLRPRRRA